MKKKVLLAIAAFAMIFAACGNKNAAPAESEAANEATEAAEAPEVEVKGTKFEGAKFTLTYPEALKETFASEETLNARNEDSSIALDATFNDMGPAVAELKTYLDNYTSMMKNMDANLEDSKIDGKILTAKYVKENGDANLHFVVMKEDKIGVSGSLKFSKDKAEEAKGYIDSIIKSIQFK